MFTFACIILLLKISFVFTFYRQRSSTVMKMCLERRGESFPSNHNSFETLMAYFKAQMQSFFKTVTSYISTPINTLFVFAFLPQSIVLFLSSHFILFFYYSQFWLTHQLTTNISHTICYKILEYTKQIKHTLTHFVLSCQWRTNAMAFIVATITSNF